MEKYDTIGTEFQASSEDLTRQKMYYLLFLLGVYFIMFFMYISPATAQTEKDLLLFYMLFGFILGVVPLLFDAVIGGNDDMPLDTIGVENNPIAFLNNGWVQAITALVFGIFVFINIQLTGQAFIKAPVFHFLSPVAGGVAVADKFTNAFLSGLCGGVIESIVFWGFIMPTMYSSLKNILKINKIAAFFGAVLGTALLFTGYHWWRYGYLITALATVFVFGIIMGVLVSIFRRQWQIMAIHFANNFAVSLFLLMAYSITVVA